MNNPDYYNDEISLKDILSILWDGKKTILFVTLFVSTLAVLYSLYLPNIYRSEAILAAADKSGNLSNLSSQYSGVASLAGISLPSSSDVDKVAMGIEVMKSLAFFEEFDSKNDIFFPLLASKGWNKSDNTLVINENIYDTSNNKWISEMDFAIDGKPSIQTAHRIFMEHVSIQRIKETGFVELSVQHYSPYLAQLWLDALIKEINNITRKEEMFYAQRSIDYLQKEISNTLLSDIRSGLNSLIETQIETMMIANATPEYLFKVLSQPIAPEEKFSPNRSIICILSFLLAFITSSFIVLLRHFFTKNN